MDTTPEILAPAGDVQSALAALAAGADAIYLGLKHFSARMEAGNFAVGELARLSGLAGDKGCRLYVAFNTLLKPGDLDAAGRLLDRLSRVVPPDACIVQDLGAVALLRQAGYQGEVHLSTLANVTHPAALRAAADAGADRVVLPRELTIDEIRAMDQALPHGLGLEVFVHGALCYCVSGRCYWSSYLGGKSGLRGRCVQPCRRVYGLEGTGRKERFFSCQDLSVDVLAKALSSVAGIKAWKIEGRKKGPHYVFYATTAYRLLRDNPSDPEAKKEAVALLERALGRPGTHYNLLPQRTHPAVEPGKPTGSGLLAGKISKTPEGGHYLQPRLELLPQDLLRIGTEDEEWHRTVKVRKRVPKRGRLDLKLPKGKKGPAPGTPVFLVDRREPELLALLADLQQALEQRPEAPRPGGSDFSPALPGPAAPEPGGAKEGTLLRYLPPGKQGRPAGITGLWLGAKNLKSLSRTLFGRIWWWLPPVIWPDEEASWSRIIGQAVSGGARTFVCNAPWQKALFRPRKDLRLVAGPFCNLANALALEEAKAMGFVQAVVSPELGREDLLALPGQSPLPLGIVLTGHFPVGLSRTLAQGLKSGAGFQSPHKEFFWVRQWGQNHWLYPQWPLDLSAHKQELARAGYRLFLHLKEPVPRELPEAQRTSLFNWDVGLL